MARSVTLDARYNGPPGSANGGYTCGMAAELVEAGARGADTGDAASPGPVEVTLRQPPPLDTPLTADAGPDAAVTLRDGSELILTARSATGFPSTIDRAPVTLADARQVAEDFDVGPYRADHPFPTCFTCGPDRAPDDGLRIFPAPMANGDGVVAWPWTPVPSIAEDDGLVARPVMWAALDCPSGLARFAHGGEAVASVLGRMTAVVHRRPAPGSPLVVAGWTVASEGRRTEAAAAVWSADGELLATSATTWIDLTPDQVARFNVQP